MVDMWLGNGAKAVRGAGEGRQVAVAENGSDTNQELWWKVQEAELWAGHFDRKGSYVGT